MNQKKLFFSVFTLSSASLIDYAIQLILPVALVRLLAPEQYAQYRLLFLIVNTAMALAPLYVPQSLFYFFPRSQSREEKGVILGNSLFFLLITGVLAGITIIPSFGLLPEKFYAITQSQLLIPCFVVIWVVSSFIDVLPNALNKIRSQAVIMLLLSILRVFAVVFSAWYTKKVEYVFYALCIFSLIKALLLLCYAKFCKDIGELSIELPLLKKQLGYSVPFGVAGGLYMMKVQADQWVAAYQFSATEYAVFTFGIYIAPLMTVLRTAINNAVLPEMSSAYALGKTTAVVELFRRANFMMAVIILPVLAALYATADGVIKILFTTEYSGAASVMRLYIFGFVAQCLESNSILRVINAGKFWIKLNASLLFIAVVTSYFGASYWGLVGAAMGSVLTLYIGELLCLSKAAHGLGLTFFKIIYWKKWSAVFFSAIVAAALGQLLAVRLLEDGLLQMAIVTLFVFMVFMILALLLVPIRMKDINLFMRSI